MSDLPAEILTPEVELFLILGALLILGKVLVSAAARWRIAPVFVLVALGVAAGPGVLGVVPWGSGAAAPASSEHVVVEVLEYIGKIGVLLILFMAGLETDLPGMRRSGKAGAAAAVGGVILPFGAGMALGLASGMGALQAAFVGTILTATSVSVSVMTLWELGRLKSPVGQGILSAAVLDDLLGILCLTVVLGFAREGTALWIVILKILGFLVVGVPFGWLVLPPVLSRARRLKAPESLLGVSFGVLFIYAAGAELCGVEPVIGAYLAGFCLSRTAFSRAISERVETVGQSLFIPLFFVTIGLQATFTGMGGHVIFMLLFVVGGVIAKVIGSGTAARLAGMSGHDSMRLGIGMIPRGEVALVIAAAGAAAGTSLVTPVMLNATVLLVVVTALITPQILRLLYRGEERPGGADGGADAADDASKSADAETRTPDSASGSPG